MGQRLIGAEAYEQDNASGAVPPLDRDAPVWIAGHRGLAGSAIWRLFGQEGFSRLIGLPRSELDLTDRASVFQFVAVQKPKAIIVAAAHVGGILANSTYPADFISRNLQIQVNVMDAAAAHKGKIDLVITDVIMPGMGGRELVQHLAKTRPATKVLYLSGYTEDTILGECSSDNAAAFLQKPFTLQTLARKVKEILS